MGRFIGTRPTAQSSFNVLVPPPFGNFWICPWWACGELQKDKKHRQEVEQMEIFVPPVIETLGLWTPYACHVLKSTAAESTLQEGLPQYHCLSKPVIEISVKLFSFNAKMVLSFLISTQRHNDHKFVLLLLLQSGDFCFVLLCFHCLKTKKHDWNAQCDLHVYC